MKVGIMLYPWFPPCYRLFALTLCATGVQLKSVAIKVISPRGIFHDITRSWKILLSLGLKSLRPKQINAFFLHFGFEDVAVHIIGHANAGVAQRP